MTDKLPSVAVLVRILNGSEHLDVCLSSLEHQVYPRDRFEVAVVDNGSSNDSVDFVRQRYPHVRTIVAENHCGPCAAVAAAVRSCGSDFVALLGDDTRVDSQWLAELVSAAERHQAAAVTSMILDWTGQEVDFVGGLTSFTGHCWPLSTRDHEPFESAPAEKRVLFPCATSALFSRARFIDTGGFDEDFFEGLEEVDLGWRLNLLGHAVVLAPKAVAYRRPPRVLSPWELAQRLRLVERNTLAMIYKNYDDEALARVLPAAVALCLARGLLFSGIDTLSLDLAAQPPDVFEAGRSVVPNLIALEDFSRQLSTLRAKRQVIQARRRRSDPELFELFGEPFRLHESGEAYRAMARTLIQDFGIDQLFASRTASSRDAGLEDALPGGAPARATLHPEQTTTRLVHDKPKVSIVILTALGPTHVRECLASLRGQTYPLSRVEVIVVDNGSAEDPTDAVRLAYPGARVLRNSTNLGFAAGNNLGASVATGDCLVFLNDDTRAHPDWLRELVGTSQRRNAAAVASCILDWSGERIDFVEGAVNFQGKGLQLHYGTVATSVTLDEKPLLFACGGAMLVDRAVLLDVGGWDEGAFAYYEDVELGWRLNLFGHHVWFAPKAVVYHKHHGTSGKWAEPPRIRLYERNSLRMLYGLLETQSLERVLPAALLLAADRALLNTRLSRADDIGFLPRRKRLLGSIKALLRSQGITRATPIRDAIARLGLRSIGRLLRESCVVLLGQTSSSRRAGYLAEAARIPSVSGPSSERLPIDAAAILSGIYGFLSDLPALSGRRERFQRRRRVTDAELLGRFGTHWLAPVAAPFQAEHDALQAALVAELGLAKVTAFHGLHDVEPSVLGGKRVM